MHPFFAPWEKVHGEQMSKCKKWIFVLMPDIQLKNQVLDWGETVIEFTDILCLLHFTFCFNQKAFWIRCRFDYNMSVFDYNIIST